MHWRHTAWLLLVLAIYAISTIGVRAAASPADASGSDAGRPDSASPAAWPALRHQIPVRLLGILDKRTSAASLQRIARRLGTHLELRYLSPGGGADEIYHVNDKWIEPKDHPTRQELHDYAKSVVIESLRQAAQSAEFDVVLLGAGAEDPEIQAAAVGAVQQGTLLVIVGHVDPVPGSPFAEIWPARPTGRNTWHDGGAQSVGHPALAGVPVSRLRGHRWMPLLEPAQDAIPLALGESGAAVVRNVGRGKILYVPSGPISRHYAAIEEFGRTYDHDEIWLRFWDHAIYELVRGEAAFPAQASFAAPRDAVVAGEAVTLQAVLENRISQGPLEVTLVLTRPTGETLERQQWRHDLAIGQQHTWQVDVPTHESWPSGWYPVYLTIRDPQRRLVLHQAMDWIEVASPISMVVQTDRRGYPVGGRVGISITASSHEPWSGELVFGIYDFRGRLLHTAYQPVNVSSEPRTVEFSWPLEEHGVQVDTYWVQAAARQDGKIWQRAETRFYKYEPWSTRNEYQWSTWSGIACGSPCTVPAGMRLMAHAGMNALGYPGRNEIFYPAERWGWRYYNENIGVNTFSPVIEYENDAEILAAVREQIERKSDRRDLYSAAFVLGSVGEEAGFKHGWGTRYYWDAPTAPDKANRAFQWLLKGKYPSLQALNRLWGTNYSAWEQVLLTREFSPGRGGKLVDFDADGWAHPQETPLGEGIERVTYAAVADTGEFYDWYYDRIIMAAKRVFREEINPVTRVMASAPTIGTPTVYDVRSAGPSAWNESQWHSLDDGPEPGFGLIWGHFDWDVKTDNMFWGWLLTRSGHNNYWVDVPLMFNNDLTHTRASFAMRRWTSQFAGHERAILDSHPAATEVGILPPNGLYQDKTREYMAKSIRVAVSQAGFGLPLEEIEDLAGCKIVFAVARQDISNEERQRLERFVRGGGTLVLTPRFSRQVADGWGLRLQGQPIARHHPRQQTRFSLGETLKNGLAGYQLAGWAVYREDVEQDGWDRLAAYQDGTPALLTRSLGQGRLVYLNAVYNSHQYIQWVTPTDADRQGFYRLIETLCSQAGAHRTMRIDGPLEQSLHMAVKQFTDSSGQIRYVIVRSSGEAPQAQGTLHWLDSQQAGYDVLSGESLARDTPLDLAPGGGQLLAFLPRKVHQIRLQVNATTICAGDPLTITPQVLDANEQPIAGAFPFELRVSCAGNAIDGLSRSFSARSSQSTVVNTALSDPSGTWRVQVTDGITGLTGEVEVQVVPRDASKSQGTAPPFIPWGWPSEIEEPATMDSAEFIDRLKRLATIYLTPQDHPWLAKQRLGCFYDFFPETRHALLRPLLDADWRDHTETLRDAILHGETLVLTGEDLGLCPVTGLMTYPHHDAHQIEAIVAAMAGARWKLANQDDNTLQGDLGQGKLVLCRESIDRAGHDNPSATAWQQRKLAAWKADAPVGISIPAPDVKSLHAWWVGTRSLALAP